MFQPSRIRERISGIVTYLSLALGSALVALVLLPITIRGVFFSEERGIRGLESYLVGMSVSHEAVLAETNHQQVSLVLVETWYQKHPMVLFLILWGMAVALLALGFSFLRRTRRKQRALAPSS
jgi:hypothetical protein